MKIIDNKITSYGQVIDLSYEHKCACPKCRVNGADEKGDNLHVYGLDENGDYLGYHCFACGHGYPSYQWLVENGEIGWEWKEGEIVGLEFNDEVLKQIKSEYSFNSNNYRGIRDEIYKYFGVMHKWEDGVIVEQIYPTFQGKDVVGFKRRQLPKKFITPYGETGKDVDFFGQFRFLNSSSREVLIVAGEIDQLSAFQMLKDYRDRANKVKGTDYPLIPVVSSTIGESGTADQARNQWEWLNRFDKIIVCMDNDKAGKEALERIAKSVPKGKLYDMKLELKDANEYLKHKKDSSFVDAFYRAKPYSPVGVKGSSGLLEAVVEHAKQEKIPLPPFMHRVQKLMSGGIPLGVIVNVIAGSGIGKSSTIDEMIYYWIFNSPYKLGILSTESDDGDYGTKILSRHVETKINLFETIEEKVEFLSQPWVIDKANELFTNPDGSDRFYLVDDRDASVEQVKSTIERMITEADCKVIVLDVLQDIIASLNDDEQNKFMSWQKGMLKSHDVTFINVNHTRKVIEKGGSASQGADITEEHTHGSSAIYKSAACNLLLTRNKEAEDPITRNTTIMKMSKCRWSGNTSPFAGKFYYDNKTHKMYDFDDFMQAHPELNSF